MRKRNIGLNAILLAFAMMVMPLLAVGQSTSTEMTVEELEKFIEQQQLALDEVKLQREQHQEVRRQVAQALVEREAELEALQDELEELCEEQKELDPNAECDI